MVGEPCFECLYDPIKCPRRILIEKQNGVKSKDHRRHHRLHHDLLLPHAHPNHHENHHLLNRHGDNQSLHDPREHRPDHRNQSHRHLLGRHCHNQLHRRHQRHLPEMH